MTAVNLNRAVRGPVTAVPVVAGHGVRLVADTVNNRFVVEADETVLWEGNGSTGPFNLSESLLNFERIKVVAYYSNKTMLFEYTIPTDSSVSAVSIGGTFYVSNDAAPLQMVACTYALSNNGQTLTKDNGRRMWHPGNDGTSFDGFTFLKIIGINRIASN